MLELAHERHTAARPDAIARQGETVAPRGSDEHGAHGPPTLAPIACLHLIARPGAFQGSPGGREGRHHANVGAHAARNLRVGDGHGTSGVHP